MKSSRLWQFRIFGATWLAYASLYLCRKNFSVILPLLRSEEGLRLEELAATLSVYSGCYCLGQLGSGLLSDRWGARRVVAAGMLFSAAATAAMGFLPGIPSLLALQAVNGLAQACGWPGVLKLMAEWIPVERRGATMAWWGSHLVVGGLAATVFATWAATGPVMVALGWRRAVWWPALALALVAAVFWTLARDGVRSTPRRPVLWKGLGEVVRNRAVQAIAGMYFCVKLTRYVFLFWLPTYMTEQLGYGVADAGYTASMFEVAGFAGIVGAGYLSDRAFGGRRFPVGSLLLLLLAGACLLHPRLASAGRWGNLAGIAFIGALIFGADALMSGAGTQDAVRTKVAATAGGVTNAVGSLGQILSAPVAALISQRFGWDAVFVLLMLFSLVGALLLMTQWGFRRSPALA